ncbi:MAG TPA: ribokinase [Gaiellaceae bacterium]|nr:ribokinase [Gaiellaceae bacterium]
MAARLTVVGSINLDLVARAERLPRPGETLTGATFTRVPGGKGANQAVAAARLGAQVVLIASVGDDEFAAAATSELRNAGVELRLKTAEAPTGVALIVVDAEGENTIVVAPGANAELRPEDVDLPDTDGVLAQLEIPLETVQYAADNASFTFFLNAAPAVGGATPLADVTIVNQYEVDELAHRDGLVVVTHGADGAIAYDGGVEVARATPPKVESVDGTAAGDAFTACLVVSILEGREAQESLQRACVAGALATTKLGAQTSLPTAEEVDALL